MDINRKGLLLGIFDIEEIDIIKSALKDKAYEYRKMWKIVEKEDSENDNLLRAFRNLEDKTERLCQDMFSWG